jgi:hypothetical protein
VRNVIFIAALGFSSLTWAQECVPSERAFRSSVTSPDGRYRVSNVFCSDQTHGRDLVLVLQNVKSGERRTLYTYNRDASVVWSPDSRWIAINDFAGSDYTNNLLVSVDRRAPSIDLQERLLHAEPQQSVLKSDHLYVAAVEWKAEGELELLAYGHDSQRRISFCRCFLISLKGRVQQCRLPNARDSEDYCVNLEIRQEKSRHVDSHPDSARKP